MCYLQTVGMRRGTKLLPMLHRRYRFSQRTLLWCSGPGVGCPRRGEDVLLEDRAVNTVEL